MRLLFWKKPKRTNARVRSTCHAFAPPNGHAKDCPIRLKWEAELIEVDAPGLGTKGKILVSRATLGDPTRYGIEGKIIKTNSPLPSVAESNSQVASNMDGLEATAVTRDGKLTAISVQPTPMIHQLTAPIVWRDDPIDTRYGPARCTPECTEVHAYAVKVDATTLAFERPCVAADMGAAEYRARQKR